VLGGLSAWAQVTRAPYLQSAQPTAITVALRTAMPSMASVRFVAQGSTSPRQVVSTVPSVVHELRLTGLTPATRYQYEVDVDGQTVSFGPEFTFRTPALPGTIEAFRMFIWGDSGTGTSSQIRVANRMADTLNNAALSLILGDIIYPVGAPEDYDPKYFAPYRRLLSRQVVWPVIGNHDVYDGFGTPWVEAFVTPANNPTRSELYYSFDWANAHIVVLDTHVSGFWAGSPQMTWAAADLAASNATWKMAAFHVPPYTGGTHADNAAVQADILPVLEDAGVDFVFAGHSHVYERSFLLSQNTILQNNRNTYIKGPGDQGTLYIVSGTAGQSGGLSNPQHPLMAVQVGNVLGTAVIDFNGLTAHGYFMEDTGAVRDLFRLSKGPDAIAPKLVAARAVTSTEIEVTFNEPVAQPALSAWSTTPPTTITNALLQPDQRTVVLYTSPHVALPYQVTVNPASDTAIPANSGSSSVSYQGIALPFDAGIDFDAGTDAGTDDAGLVFDGGVDAGLSFDAGQPLIDGRTSLRAWVGTADPPFSWKQTAFDDSSWLGGRLPIGYGEPTIATPVVMGDAGTLYTRLEFDMPADLEAENLWLEVDYDDGFIAYLNGFEIARQGLPAGADHLALAVNHESGAPELFALPGAEAFLRPGDNMLAIEVHNTALTSSDLFLNARLWANTRVPPMDAGVRFPDDDGGTGADDAGRRDAGIVVRRDGGSRSDGGLQPPAEMPSCGCTQVDWLAGWFVVGLSLLRRRMRA
jgi:hypothetical protein